MTPAERNYQRTGLKLRIARARVLLDLAGKVDADQLEDLLTFAAQLGDCTSADSLAAFRAAQEDALRAAQADLDRLPDEGRP